MAVVSEVVIFPDAAEEVTDTAECRSFLGRVALEAKGVAQGSAPVLTGAYRDSIDGGLVSATRPESQLWANISYWHYLEYGTINNRPFRTLTNALIKVTERQEITG
jgi:hypothetical protein